MGIQSQSAYEYASDIYDLARDRKVQEGWEHRPQEVLPSFFPHIIWKEERVRRYIRIIQGQDEKSHQTIAYLRPDKRHLSRAAVDFVVCFFGCGGISCFFAFFRRTRTACREYEAALPHLPTHSYRYQATSCFKLIPLFFLIKIVELHVVLGRKVLKFARTRSTRPCHVRCLFFVPFSPEIWSFGGEILNNSY